jgi:hypothetical protein
MKRYLVCFALLLISSSLLGCRAEVKSTPDSNKIEVEVPKVEVNKTPDLDPKTDDDVDVKTPGADK